MATEEHLLLVLLLLVLPVAVRGGDKLEVHADLDEPLILSCKPENKVEARFQYWTIPDGTHNTVADHADSIQLMEFGWTLRIPEFTKAHFGDYSCNYLNATGGVLVTDPIEVQDMKPSTFERYRMSILIGMVAAAAALVVLVVICVLYNCRWEARHRHTDTKPFVNDPMYDGTASTRVSVPEYNYANDGYVHTIDDVTVKNTKL